MAAKTRRLNPNEVQEIRELLRTSGIRATPARIAVLQELRGADSPLTHADVAEKLVPLGFDKATVFRNLADLTEAELISRTELGITSGDSKLSTRTAPAERSTRTLSASSAAASPAWETCSSRPARGDGPRRSVASPRSSSRDIAPTARRPLQGDLAAFRVLPRKRHVRTSRSGYKHSAVVVRAHDLVSDWKLSCRTISVVCDAWKCGEATAPRTRTSRCRGSN